MLKFEWNALRSGDKVLVHDPRSPEMALTSAVVMVSDTRKGANGVGMRLPTDGGDDLILWPSRLVVHPDPATRPSRVGDARNSRTAPSSGLTPLRPRRRGRPRAPCGAG